MKRAHMIRIAPFQDRSIINDAIANKYASVGWDDIGSAKNMTYEELRDSLIDCYGYEGRQVSPSLSAIWHMKNDVKIGDYVVSPNGYDIHIGKVVREYYFAGDNAAFEATGHRVGVEWFTTPISRDDLSEDLRSTLRNQRTYSCLDEYVEEIRSLVEPTSFAELSSLTLTAKITLNHCTEITVSGLPKNLDSGSVEALCNEIRDIYRRKNA